MESIVLNAFERLVNAQLETSTPARERIAALEGRRLGVHLRGPEVAIVITAGATGIAIKRAAIETADASISGTPLALLEAWRQGESGLVANDAVTLRGDLEVAEQFVALLRSTLPDVEEVLAELTGDVVAHEVARLGSAVGAWGKRALEAVTLNVGEYLQEESRALPSRHETEGFFRDLERLRDDVERATARVERLLEPAHEGTAADRASRPEGS